MIKLDLNPTRSQLRQFAWIALIGFPLVGVVLSVWLAKLDTTFLWIMLALGAVMGLCAAIDLMAVVRPVYVVMMLVAWPIGMVVSTLLMALIFYGMFTPVGLAFRLLGRDPLHRKIDPSADSYWIRRRAQRPPASYLRLY